MLVLTRRIGERLRIGPDVEVVVLEVRGREVRLGLSAPASVVIHREEIYRRIEQANRESVLAAPGLPEAMVRAARVLRQREASVATPCAPTSDR